MEGPEESLASYSFPQESLPVYLTWQYMLVTVLQSVLPLLHHYQGIVKQND